MRFKILLLTCFFALNASAQTIQQLKDSAATFPPMPRGTTDLVPFTTGLPTFASGAPFDDLEFTIFDTDYMDGENSGGDVFMPLRQPSRIINCWTNLYCCQPYHTSIQSKHARNFCNVF
jgi:hypothetical protein